MSSHSPCSARLTISSHRFIQVRYTTWVVLQFMELVIDYVLLLDTPRKVWFFTIFSTMIAITTTKNAFGWAVSGSKLLTSLCLLVGAILKLIPWGFGDDLPYLPCHCSWMSQFYSVFDLQGFLNAECHKIRHLSLFLFLFWGLSTSSLPLFQVTKLCCVPRARVWALFEKVSLTVLHQNLYQTVPIHHPTWTCSPQTLVEGTGSVNGWVLKCGQNLINGAGASRDESGVNPFG